MNISVREWYYISRYNYCSEDFIRENQNNVNWFNISQYQKLSEDFIREFQDKVNWFYISTHQKLSEDFIREFKDKVDWLNISSSQKLSENFIKEFEQKIKWTKIVKYQKLSEEFIREFVLKKFDLQDVIKYQYLSNSFFNDYKCDKPFVNSNWLYASNERKRIYVESSYELVNDNIIAYKAVRQNDRYSYFNFQNQFLPNSIVEDHCDYNIYNNYSCGLHAWTFGNLCNSYSKIIKVSIKLEDLGAVISGSKLRARKITVLD